MTEPDQKSGVTIHIRNVSKVFGADGDKPFRALKPIDVTIPAGQFISVVGASGCGKSTLMLMIAGLLEDGSLGAGQIQAAAGTIAVHGQHLARSAIRFSADSLSLAGSETAGARLDLVARAGDIDASGARIGIDETLTASAAGTFRSDAAQISAARLDFTARNLSNRAGSLIQTGGTDLAIRLPGRFDNQGGRFASASAALDLAAIAIDNSEGRIEHVGGGSFSLATPTLNGPRGSLFSAGNLRIGATDVILDRADSLQIDSVRLSNIGGQIVQSGSGPARVHATAVFDNGSGSLVANGRLDLTAGELRNVAGKVLATADAGLVVTVDGAAENRGGSLVAGGDLSVAAATLGNVGGSLRAGQDGAVRLGGAVDNTDGTLAAGRRLDVDAASLDNRRGLVHSAAGGLGVHVVGALLNPLGEIFAGTDLDLRAGSLVSSGTLYSQRDLRIAVADTLSSSGSLAAAGNLSLSAYRFAGTAGSPTSCAARHRRSPMMIWYRTGVLPGTAAAVAQRQAEPAAPWHLLHRQGARRARTRHHADAQRRAGEQASPGDHGRYPRNLARSRLSSHPAQGS